MRADGAYVRTWLAAELARCVKVVGARTTITDTEELVGAVDAIVEEFPTLKIEEVALVFSMLARGRLLQLYGTFKTPQLMEAFRLYEGNQRCDVLERAHVVPDPPAWRERSAQRLAREDPFKPITLSKADLQGLGIWPEDSAPEAE